jgi:hypothetical protein
MSSFGREVIRIIEIDQPQCSRTYGDAFSSPTGGCTAQLGTDGTRKCYNTRATCQDPENYDPATLTLRFSEPQLDLSRYYGNVLPSVKEVSNTPAQVNLGGLDKSASPLGQREVVNIQFEDHQHSDHLVDKYRTERLTGEASSESPAETFDPYTRGTFWGKWLARNPYYTSYALRVKEGYLGDSLGDLRVRHYIVDRIDGPKDGIVRLTAKDQFSKIEARKAVAPKASRGELLSGISDSDVSATLSPTGIGDLDYPIVGSPGEFYVAIGDEVIRVSRSSDTLTLLERGALNTVADSHDAEDLVQLVLVYESQSPHDIAYDLLTNYSEIPASSIDQAEWDTKAAQITDLYTARIATPTPVADLLGELCLQAGFTLWADVSTGEIKLAALRPGVVTPTVTDAEWIVDGSLSVKRQIEKRISQAWVYYGQVSPIEDLEEEQNFRSRLVVIDSDAEDTTQYGEPAIMEVFSRWIPQFGRQSAQRVGDRLVAMFRDPPVEAKFNIHVSRDGELDIGNYFGLETFEIQDDTGEKELIALATTSLDRGLNEIEVMAQSVAFTAETDDGIRKIYIENDTNNINLRELHDTLYQPPTSDSPSQIVEFYVLENVVVGSDSTSQPSITTGSWPGTQLTLDISGRVQGKAGMGGNGGTFNNAGAAGGAGGIALQATHQIHVRGSGGVWGGGGGGGGGGGAVLLGYSAGGGGGGGGSGTPFGIGGNAGSTNGVFFINATPGSNGTDSTGGSGGTGGFTAVSVSTTGGNGGAGGAPGQAGSSGTASTGDGALASGGAGGAAGAAISGVSFVTFESPSLDIKGSQV